MNRSNAKSRTLSLLRTPCNVAALVAIGLLAETAGPAFAATAGNGSQLLNNVVLRGLVSDYRTSATFATANTGAVGGQTLTITQLLPKIILDWNQFNLGNGDTIQFVQPSSSAAVLNRIYDANPSTIAGAIKANGQVYLVNQNGILFHNGAQIDTNSFFASTLNIDDATFKTGVTTGGLFTPAFTGGYDATGKTTASGRNASITVGGGTGAAPTIAAHAGGAVVIIAPVIDNRSGVITSPDGQVILAAGNSAYLGFSATNNTGFRGMLVEVTADASGPINLTSLINNTGTIGADRGNVTLAGLAINQGGRVSASTAMLTNGSIYLQARTLDNAQRGTVTLAAGSVTETPLDLHDTTTLSEATSFTPYQPVVQVTGRTIDVAGRITSPSGVVTLDAAAPAGTGAARIYLDNGSTIDASGAWSTASDASNLLTFKVTSTELKTAPDQAGGILAGATVTVDLRQGSSVLDLSGYQANQARTLQQKAAVGGSVTLSSTGDVIERADATINVSGGGVKYTGVTEATSKLLGSDGKLYDIATAPEALRYKSVADTFVDTQARWGYSPVYTNLLMGASVKRPDFTQGAAGGALNIKTSAGSAGVVLDGRLLGGTTTGSQQTAAAPRGAALVIGTYDSTRSSQDVGVGDVTFQSGSPSSLQAGFALDSALSDQRKTQVTLSSDLFSQGKVDANGNYVTNGFGSLEVDANGRVTVPENVTLNGPLGGTLILRGNQVEVDGHVNVPGGTIVAQAIVTPGTSASPPQASNIVVGQGAGVSAQGAWINSATAGVLSPTPSAMANASSTGQAAVAPSATTNGGSIALQAPVVLLDTSSALDVSAGGTVSVRGAFAGGSGGSIALTATAAPSATVTPLTLDGTLAGEGFGNGGTLSLSTSDAIRIAAVGDATTAAGLALDTAFFRQGGFQSYKISAEKDLTIASGALLSPRQVSLQIDPVAAQALATGADARAASTLVTLTDDQRKPTSLALNSGATLTMARSTGIGTDAGGSVALSGQSGVIIDGTVYAPGGSIAVTDKNLQVSAGTLDSALPTIEIGAHAILSTHGTFTATPNDRHLVQGNLSAGGTVTLNASAAHLQLDAGSVVDVGGASQRVDLPAVVGASVPFRSVLQSSNAGSVSIVANDSVTLGGAIRGNADGTAAGGTFSLNLGERGDIADPDSKRRIVVTQSGAAQPAAANFKDAAVSVDRLRDAGFDKLNLGAEDQILFAGDATLAFQRGVTLDTKLLQVAGGANVAISGAAVKLANSTGSRQPKNPNDPTDRSTQVNLAAAPAAQPVTVGQGSLRVNADTLDVNGDVAIGGTQSTTLSAVHDLRLSGRTVGQASDAGGAKIVGALTTAGDLTLSAAQVYPSTASTFTVAVGDGVPTNGGDPLDVSGTATPGGRLHVTHGTGALGDALSAGGSLTLKADNIAQDGVVKAPLGTLNLVAGKTLTLGSTSVTSVSADGLTIPYGETRDGVAWTYAALNGNPLTSPLSAPPAKNIALAAPAVDVLSGAKVDVSGGGDLAAIEWVPAGKSTNALIAPNTYAILPAAGLSSAPIDPDIALTQSPGLDKAGVYNSIHIGAGGAVPAGDYVLLPGYYGLLKGGYLVQLLTGSTYANLQPGQTATLQNGLTVVPGVLDTAGTGVASAATIGVVVRPGSDIARLASYTVTNSAFFAKLADANRTAVPLLPTDGGQLSISATQRLTLNGTLAADLPSATSRSAEVDISAARIALVDQVGRGDVGADYLQIDSGGLSRLNADLLIGGVRTSGSTGEVLTPTATDIVVANSDSNGLKAPELTLAATDSITVRAGSRVEASGAQVAKPVDFTVGGPGASSGAILRISNGGLAKISRPVTDAASGSITIESGATLAASGSLALDATRTTRSSGKLDIAAGGALALVSGSIALGQTDAIAGLDSGLVLDNADLAGFGALGTLSLKSYNGITLFGDTRVGSAGLANLVIDSASLTAQAAGVDAPAAVRIAAGKVSLINTSGVDAAAGASGAGTFTVDAGQIVLGAGSKQIAGVGDTRLNATGAIVAADTGSLQTASPLELSSARIDSVSGAHQSWTAQTGSVAGSGYQPVTINAVAAPAALGDSTALGSRVQVTGSAIVDGGSIVMRSGGVSLQAMGPAATDGVQLLPGASIDAGGAHKSFQGTTAVADAGSVTLSAANGNVSLGGGSSVNVAADAAGGNAGSLAISGRGVDLSGTLSGASAGGVQGSVAIDVANLADFGALNATLKASGFTEGLDVRVREQGLTVAAGTVVQAHHLALESDAGAVTIAGRLDASAALGGGSVDVSGHDVQVAPGARIDASATSLAAGTATSPYANGGAVSLVAEGGSLDFAAGAVVDVRAGEKGQAGSVLLRAPRTTDPASPLAATLAGQVLSQRHARDAAAAVTVEGNQVYTLAPGATIDAAAVAGYGADNLAFMHAVDATSPAAGILGDDGARQANLHVRPGVEVVAPGDLAIASNWDLTGAGWRIVPAGGNVVESGTLNVRAAGNLTLAGASIGNPDNALQAGATWSVGLTSGADTTAANASRTRSATALDVQAAGGAAGAGDLVLDSANGEASVRTGTGAIRLSAGRDFVIKAGTDPETGAAVAGVVYTAGVAAPLADPVVGPADARFAQGGGDITISAQRNAVGAGNEWMTEWFRSATDLDGGLGLGAWWAYRPNFHDGVAALGGGNVTIRAGNDVQGLSAFVPTSGIEIGSGTSASLATFGGGNLVVDAGNDILGGQYLVSLGRGTISAGGNVGTPGRTSQLFMMGASGDAALAGATASVRAGGAINLATIDSPSSLLQTQTFGDQPSFNTGNELPVLSYTGNGGVSLVAKAGDLTIGNRPNDNLALDPLDQPSIERELKTPSGAALLPARVAFTAFNGNVVYTGTTAGMMTFPSPDGSAKVLAGQGVKNLNLRVSDADAAQFAIQNMSQAVTSNYSNLLAGIGGAATRLATNNSTDAFINDIVAAGGSIQGATLIFPARSRIWAAADVVDPRLSLQNLSARDLSEVVADQGSVLVRQPGGWGIDGPGTLVLQAGRNVDLGTAALSSFGNLRNVAIASAAGADIDVVAGYSGQLDWSKLDTTFDHLVTAGSAKNVAAATAAVDGFFAKAQVGKGDIDSFNTSIQSNAGGGINLLAPGGNITVGLTTPNDNKLVGVVTNAGGAIRSFLSGDFDINQGKVLTAQGGNILIYTSGGGIDAGRGAKTSVTTPPPTRTPVVDPATGFITGYTYSVPVAVAGSGIQTATSKPGGPESVAPPAGNIYLFAPAGTIDAGEAGIASGGAIFIAALTVLNADNITAVGPSQGVPVTPPGSVASTVAAAGGNTVAPDAKAGDAAAQAAAAAAAAGVTNFRPAILTVEVMGFGEKNCKETDKDCFAK